MCIGSSRRGPGYSLHLGLTEAGMGRRGIVSSTAALSVLLQEGIGDTIRASLTPVPGGDRTEEVRTCQDVLQSLAIRTFSPQVTACPGCGRTTSTTFQEMARDIRSLSWRPNGGLARNLRWYRESESRRHGMRRQRARRIETREHRDIASRNRRGSKSPCLCGRPFDDNS